MKSVYALALMASICTAVHAQDAYDAMNYATKDLNGSARYVGMGGALSALGGDVSVINANPAGTGLFRRSDASFGVSILSTGENALSQGKTRLSFDQLGLVVAIEGDEGLRYVNLGFNVKKTRNFFSNIDTSVGGLLLNGKPTFSQTMQIADYANDANHYDNWNGALADLSADAPEKHPGILGYDDTSGLFYGTPAKSANYTRATHGGNYEYDFNVAFNISDRYFIGATIGLYDIEQNRESSYIERGVDNYAYRFNNWYQTTGSGVDFRIGAIIRPFEESPFRFGISFKTGTLYRLTDTNGATLLYDIDSSPKPASYSTYSSEYDYTYRDPWSVNVSAGYTIGKNIALGLEYEYQDFSAASYTAKDSRDDNYFREVNNVIKTIAKGQHTIKFGAEYKPVSNVSLRIGYNRVTSPYDMNGFRDLTFDSPQTETDWVNWKDINRFCAGVGFRFDNCYLDFAYQYQAQKGDFYAFNDFVIDDVDKVTRIYNPATSINNNRSQILATFGIKF